MLNIAVQIVLNNLHDNSSLSVIENVLHESMLPFIQLISSNFDYVQVSR